MKRAMSFSLLICGIWALVSPLLFIKISHNTLELQDFINQLISQKLLSSASGLTWFEVKVVLEGGLGIVMIASVVLMAFRTEKIGSWIAMISLLVGLTVINLLVFYFEQFSTILMAAIQFLSLLLTTRYRKRFLRNN